MSFGICCKLAIFEAPFREPLDIYLSEASANSLYAFADTIAGRVMFEAICPSDPSKAFGMLISETSRTVGWINIITGKLTMKCLERNLGGNLYSLGARIIELDGAPSPQSVSIPYFVEVSSCMSRRPNRAEAKRRRDDTALRSIARGDLLVGAVA